MANQDVDSDAAESKLTGFEGLLFRPNGTCVDGLRGMFAESSVFLVCGGPSVGALDMSLLRQRGIITAAVNQVAATHVRPNLWISCDDQRQFSETIWLDPAIMKFVKRKYLYDPPGISKEHSKQWKKQIRRWSPETQTFAGSGLMPRDCPNVFGYDHWKGWDATTYLDDPRPTWGIQHPTFLSVMLVAPWLLYWLGFRTIYLVWADFKMNERKPYAFDQSYTGGEVAKNNGLYHWLRARFREVAPHLESHGLRVVNCNPRSKLDAFPMMPFEDAVAEVVQKFPAGGRVDGHYKR